MKEAVGLTQRQVNIQNRFLKWHDTSFRNEHVVRKYSKQGIANKYIKIIKKKKKKKKNI